MIERGNNADSFVIVGARVLDIMIVTNEKKKLSASKIRDICKHFHIECINLEMFMELEGWVFWQQSVCY